jgi:hypothetical protein
MAVRLVSDALYSVCPNRQSKISSKKRLTRGALGGNLFRHPKRRDRRDRREGSASGLRDGTEAGSGNLENDTEKRSEQRQLILRENRANCFVGTETR